jgi:hypothetical protein
VKKLAVSSGTVVYELDNKIIIARKPARWTTTFMFVSGLITLITLVNGALQILFHPGIAISITLFGSGILFLVVTILIAKYRKKVNAIPWSELEVICKLDHGTGKVIDSQEQVIGELSEARLKRQMQLTSSSPALVLLAGSRKIKLVKGSPFSGGVSAVHKALLERGIKKK